MGFLQDIMVMNKDLTNKKGGYKWDMPGMLNIQKANWKVITLRYINELSTAIFNSQLFSYQLGIRIHQPEP
jgi:hypothetical protein